MRKPEKKLKSGASKRSVKATDEGDELHDPVFAVKESELRRLLRLSNVQAYHDCRRRPLPDLYVQPEV